MEDRDWVLSAGCRGHAPDDWFGGGEGWGRKDSRAATKWAKRVCLTSCLVRAECLTEAMEREGPVGSGFRHGIWGGLTPAERYRLWQDRQRRVAGVPAGSGP